MSTHTRFLRRPELLEPDARYQLWGTLDATLELPGGPYRLSGLSAAQRSAVTARFGDFVRPGELDTAPVALVIERAERDAFAAVETPGWQYGIDCSYGERWTSMSGWNFAARLDRGAILAVRLRTPLEGTAFFAQALENVLRVLVAHRLLDRGGVLLHSAAALSRGRCFLFCGPSGAGKSTIARLCRESGRETLSDDLNAITRGSGGYRVGGIPFSGELPPCRPGPTVPLDGIFRLVKGSAHATRPLAAGAGVAFLATCAPYVNVDPYRAPRLLGNLERIARAVRLQQLTFAPDAGFWPHVER